MGSGDYRIVPQRRFLQLWFYTYVAFFGLYFCDLPWQVELLLCRFTLAQFLSRSSPDHKLTLDDHLDLCCSVIYGTNLIRKLLEERSPLGLLLPALLAYQKLFPIQTQPPAVCLPQRMRIASGATIIAGAATAAPFLPRYRGYLALLANAHHRGLLQRLFWDCLKDQICKTLPVDISAADFTRWSIEEFMQEVDRQLDRRLAGLPELPTDICLPE